MTPSVTLVVSLLVVVTMAAPAPTPEETLRALINPPQDGTTATASDNMVSDVTASAAAAFLPSGQTFKTVTDLKDALATSIKAQLMTSLASMTPEVASTAGAVGFDGGQMSQLNLMGGINSLVSLIVEKILQALLPNILGGGRPAPAPAPVPVPATPQYPTGGFPGMFGGMGSMMMPMMFGMMDGFF